MALAEFLTRRLLRSTEPLPHALRAEGQGIGIEHVCGFAHGRAREGEAVLDAEELLQRRIDPVRLPAVIRSESCSGLSVWCRT